MRTVTKRKFKENPPSIFGFDHRPAYPGLYDCIKAIIRKSFLSFQLFHADESL